MSDGDIYAVLLCNRWIKSDGLVCSGYERSSGSYSGSLPFRTITLIRIRLRIHD